MSEAAALVLAPLRIEAWAVRRGAPQLRVVRAGMGPARARLSAERWRLSPARCVAVAGLCGALGGGLSPGDLVVPDVLVTAGGAELEVAGARLRALLERRGLSASAGPILGVDHAVRGAERERLRESGAVAVDMESPWLAAAAAGRPFAVLRVVVDGPGHELLRPGVIGRGWRALSRLREASGALGEWCAATSPQGTGNA